MQDVLVALYDEHADAVSVRTALVADGFATDRIYLTSPLEHRQADKGPAEDFAANVHKYFRTLGASGEELKQLEGFAQAVIEGASALTVHPRGEEEIKRVERIVNGAKPRDVFRYMPEDSGHVLDRKIERAAAPPER